MPKRPHGAAERDPRSRLSQCAPARATTAPPTDQHGRMSVLPNQKQRHEQQHFAAKSPIAPHYIQQRGKTKDAETLRPHHTVAAAGDKPEEQSEQQAEQPDAAPFARRTLNGRSAGHPKRTGEEHDMGDLHRPPGTHVVQARKDDLRQPAHARHDRTRMRERKWIRRDQVPLIEHQLPQPHLPVNINVVERLELQQHHRSHPHDRKQHTMSSRRTTHNARRRSSRRIREAAHAQTRIGTTKTG